ncbi:MAG: TetR/AcrR family transcriptional regulator [Lachnospiraceae bacterium]|nr:TetR/AcrR family transcriptional regulator [Lachnospiraceae bacterium]
MKNDRRIRRTRAAIQSAFLKLIFEKDINKITIKELCERADINKSTFYLHYQDIYDLEAQFKEELSEKVCHIILEYEVGELIPKAPEIWLRILNLPLDERMTLSSLKDTSLKHIIEDIGADAIHAILDKLASILPPQNEEQLWKHHIFTTFIISGFLGVLRSFDKDELIHKEAYEKIAEGLEKGISLG